MPTVDGYYCCRHFQCVGKHDKKCPNFWTAHRVKDELPDVTIRVGKTVYPGVVAGRLLPFAKVCFADGCGATMEFAWETIAECLNRGVPLRA